jgi:hypothetical protein
MRTHGLSQASDGTYKTWQAMIQRCTNPKCRSYKDYGERGITVAPEWMTFVRFLSDMGMRPHRIDNDGGYSKQNCRWQTVDGQNQNRRSVRLNPDRVREIRRLASEGARGSAISRQLNVSIATVSMVINRHTWKNVE